MKVFFTGRGRVKPPSQALPWVDNSQLEAPEYYTCTSATAAAVNTAIHLGKPLLITGEPGCGKSRLAHRVAWELNLAQDNPLQITIKSTSEANDLFYNFDTVGRFYAAQIADSAQPAPERPENYIRFCGLGLAILRAKGLKNILHDKTLRKLGNERTLSYIHPEPQRSIVLIDEIDKAPREVPNDILDEIEALRFTVPELGILEPIALSEQDKQFLPIVLITNNSERDLPEAFLRRCLFHHLEFPPFQGLGEPIEEGQVTVEKIVAQRFQTRFKDTPPLIRSALSLCDFLRSDNATLSKAPSLAEILLFIDYCLRAYTNTSQSLREQNERDILHALGSILLKDQQDVERAAALYRAWQQFKA